MKQLYDFTIIYSVKALSDDYKWLEKNLQHSKANIIATTKDIIVKRFNKSFEKENLLEPTIENIEKVPHKVYQLQKWANSHEPEEEMIYKKGYWDQIIFIRDRVVSLLHRIE